MGNEVIGKIEVYPRARADDWRSATAKSRMTNAKAER